MKKYKLYYYTTPRCKGGFTWHIKNKELETLESATEVFSTRQEALDAVIDAIDEYYR
jgi:hypothetical protein